eukprot:6369531-Amphidinium_carterae.1
MARFTATTSSKACKRGGRSIASCGDCFQKSGCTPSWVRIREPPTECSSMGRTKKKGCTKMVGFCFETSRGNPLRRNDATKVPARSLASEAPCTHSFPSEHVLPKRKISPCAKDTLVVVRLGCSNSDCTIALVQVDDDAVQDHAFVHAGSAAAIQRNKATSFK